MDHNLERSLWNVHWSWWLRSLTCWKVNFLEFYSAESIRLSVLYLLVFCTTHPSSVSFWWDPQSLLRKNNPHWGVLPVHYSKCRNGICWGMGSVKIVPHFFTHTFIFKPKSLIFVSSDHKILAKILIGPQMILENLRHRYSSVQASCVQGF